MSRFSLRVVRPFGTVGVMRDRLTRAKLFGECDGFEEAKHLIRSVFYVKGAREGLAREIMGNLYIDSLYAFQNQKAAMANRT